MEKQAQKTQRKPNTKDEIKQVKSLWYENDKELMYRLKKAILRKQIKTLILQWKLYSENRLVPNGNGISITTKINHKVTRIGHTK